MLINAAFLNFLFNKESIVIDNKELFIIDNNQKCFLSSKSAYYYDFWRSCDTEDWSNDAENTALITEINYILTYYHIKVILNCNNISNFYDWPIFDQINAALSDVSERLILKRYRFLEFVMKCYV